MDDQINAKPYFNTIVVIPISSESNRNFIFDTINSFLYYNQLSYKIIIADGSQQGLGREIALCYSNCETICTETPMGKQAVFYITLSLAFRHAVENYRFSVLLKLSTDALVIGAAPQKEILERLQLNPLIGIAGLYPSAYHNNTLDFKRSEKRILNGTRTWGFFSRPFANWNLIKLYKQALKNGYTTGESIIGGAYFMSEAFLRKLYDQGFLPKYAFRSLNLVEDHLFSLLAKAFGFGLENLSATGQPFGSEWKGLPASPAKFLVEKKKILQAVNFLGAMQEYELRSFFRGKRSPYQRALI